MSSFQADFGASCPWEEIAEVFPWWVRDRLNFNEVEGWNYPKRVLRLQHLITDMDPIEKWNEQDTFLTQYLGEAVLEAVSIDVIIQKCGYADRA